MTIATINENNLNVIAGIEINDSILEEVNYRLIDRADEIDCLYNLISECKNSDKELMIDDQQYLISLSDEYVFSNYSTNEFIAYSDTPIRFNGICEDILVCNGLPEEEAKLLFEEDNIETEFTKVLNLLDSMTHSGINNVIDDSEFDWSNNKNRDYNLKALAKHCINDETGDELNQTMKYLFDMKKFGLQRDRTLGIGTKKARETNKK